MNVALEALMMVLELLKGNASSHCNELSKNWRGGQSVRD